MSKRYCPARQVRSGHRFPAAPFSSLRAGSVIVGFRHHGEGLRDGGLDVLVAAYARVDDRTFGIDDDKIRGVRRLVRGHGFSVAVEHEKTAEMPGGGVYP